MKYKIYTTLLIIIIVFLLANGNNYLEYFFGEKYQIVSIRMDKSINSKEQDAKIKAYKIQVYKNLKKANIRSIVFLISLMIIILLIIKSKKFEKL